MTRTERGLILFQNGFNCSQAVLASFTQDLELPEEKALMIASGFGAGMGRMSRTCGAVTGAFMALGLKAGFFSGETKGAKEVIYRLIREFGDAFAAIHGSLECRELLGFDISTPDGYKEAADSGIFRDACPRFVESAIEITEKLLRLEE
jgi:C_GCAxxG_C_C family probable redox protein